MFVRGLKCEYLASNTISSKSFQTLPFHGLTNLTINATHEIYATVKCCSWILDCPFTLNLAVKDNLRSKACPTQLPLDDCTFRQ